MTAQLTPLLRAADQVDSSRLQLLQKQLQLRLPRLPRVPLREMKEKATDNYFAPRLHHGGLAPSAIASVIKLLLCRHAVFAMQSTPAGGDVWGVDPRRPSI
jgi:hypothetical protein